MTELTIKVKAEDWEDIIGIKENIAIALEEIQGVKAVEVIDIQQKRDV